MTTPSPWTDPTWRSEAEAWVTAALADRGVTITGPFDQPRVRPWSSQLTVPTDVGTVWFKVNCPGSQFEAALVAVLAERVPERVVVPLAVDAERGWLLNPDAGPTLRDGSDEAAWVAVLQQWGELQREVSGCAGELLATGLPELPPAAATTWVQAYADRLAGLGTLSPDDRAAVQRGAPALEEATELLSAGPVPLSLEHNDLHAGNAFMPSPGGRLRYFDFGDALWAHPFSTVWLARRTMAHHLEADPDDRRVARAVDAYLEVWSDLAPRSELVALLGAAARFGPVHRTHSWARCLDSTDPASWPTEWSSAAHDWLVEFARADD